MNAAVFSTGFTFFYWEHFGDKSQKRRVQNERNINDYGGHTQFELFISKSKYQSIKEEVLSNTDSEVGIEEYNCIRVKAEQYMTTQRVKSMRAEKNDCDDTINYDIEEDAPITISHLKSLLFYTDFNKLSASFTRTFRRVFAGEALESVKQRNMCYYWMSKLIIETVNCFGTNGWVREGGESGPFFTGMGVVISVPSFRIRLCGPVSTSKEILVAQNFAKDNGIILELNNQTDHETKNLRFFNVSWLSKYSEENERIFVHGQWSIEISSIRLTANWNNFGNFFGPLSKFDAAISGGSVGAVQGFSAKDRDMIRLLFAEDTSLPKYISDTFKMFRFHKKTICIDLEQLIGYGGWNKGYPSALQELIVGKVYKGGSEDSDNIFYEEFEDNRNLLKSELVNLFPNLTDIVLQCTQWRGNSSYQFSLFGILDMLNQRRRNKIKVSLYGVWKDWKEDSGDRRSWLYYVYSKISSALKKKYKKIKITLQETKDNYDNRQDLLVFL